MNPVLSTSRLTLVGVNGALLRADLQGAATLAAALRHPVSPAWPPQYYDEDAIRYSLAALEHMAEDCLWRMYYIVLTGSSGQPPELIGTCGYKGPPDNQGEVEIGYGIVAPHQGRGYASETAQALTACAYRAGARSVAAETLPELGASRRVLEKCGFVFIGQGSEPGAIRYRHRAGAGDHG
ncbi:MAG: GNAT family N-acetyltransferase [Betaproteobacteria bacterium]|nr:GNAT family N-acetyltransferase [Betaproteobacteria bacterium]